MRVPNRFGCRARPPTRFRSRDELRKNPTALPVPKRFFALALRPVAAVEGNGDARHERPAVQRHDVDAMRPVCELLALDPCL